MEKTPLIHREKLVDGEPCPVCGDGDNVPTAGYFLCPRCDAEYDNDDYWNDPDAPWNPK